jgi:hypothetical protein
MAKPKKQTALSTEADTLVGVPTNQQADPLLEENQSLKLELQQLSMAYNALEEKYLELASLPISQPGTQAAHRSLSGAEGIPDETFEVDGQLFRMTVTEVAVRKLGKRTALDILADDEPYTKLGGLTIKAWLVANNSSAVAPVSPSISLD